MIEKFSVRKRKLPHWELPGSMYFVTFTTADDVALSDLGKDIVFNSIRFHAGKKYELSGCVVMETHAHMILRPLEAQARTPGTTAPQKVQAGTPVLPAAQAPYYSLAEIMHSIKRYSAHRIGKITHNEGSIWLDESYDRVVRDDADYAQKMEYIIYNPVKAGLVEKPEDYKWLYVETPR